MFRLGVVSFLNSRPLICGLDTQPAVRCVGDVPAALPALLDAGEVDAALIPLFDVLSRPGRYTVVSDGCIACDGETMTVRVFSQVPPDRITQLRVDTDSHTSVALARVLWRELYAREIELTPLERAHDDREATESVLLIGDKVVDPARGSFAYEVDLGGAWRQHTGLPFVFAVWATRADADVDRDAIGTLLSEARDRGVAEANEIACAHGPTHGWPPEVARRYLTRCLRYRLDERMIAGAEHFGRLCAASGLVPEGAAINWPESLTETSA